MKRYKAARLLRIALIPIVIVLVAACGQAPEEEMAAARQAVEEAAANPDVGRYAPQSLEKARQLLSEMEAAAENGEHDSARSLAREASDAAERAVQEAEAAKARARNDAEAAVSAASTALEEARNALDDARSVPGIRLDFQAARSDLESGASEVAAAEADLRDELFSESETKAENARASISNVVRRISDAVQAASRK